MAAGSACGSILLLYLIITKRNGNNDPFDYYLRLFDYLQEWMLGGVNVPWGLR